jgi:hypothetical protein
VPKSEDINRLMVISGVVGIEENNLNTPTVSKMDKRIKYDLIFKQQ